MSMHYDSESLVDQGRSPRLFALLVIQLKFDRSTCIFTANVYFFFQKILRLSFSFSTK